MLRKRGEVTWTSAINARLMTQGTSETEMIKQYDEDDGEGDEEQMLELFGSLTQAPRVA